MRISLPSKGRYPEGAPIAVHMLSAIPRVNGSIACLSEQGFIDVGFLCPGAQYKSPDGTIRKSGDGWQLRVHSMRRETKAVEWWRRYVGRPPDFGDAFIRAPSYLFEAVGWVIDRGWPA